jgi:hypothetical protein
MSALSFLTVSTRSRVTVLVVCAWLGALCTAPPVLSAARASGTVPPSGQVTMSALSTAPAAGTPDPAQMVLQPSDFAVGAPVLKQGYLFEPPFVSGYERVFASGITTSGAIFNGVTSRVELAADQPQATASFIALRTVVRSRVFQTELAVAITHAAPRRARLHARDVHFGHIRSLGVGDDSMLLPVSVRAKGMKLAVDLVFLRVDRAIGTLSLAGLPGLTIQLGETVAVSGALVDHIHAGLTAPPGVAPSPVQ